MKVALILHGQPRFIDNVFVQASWKEHLFSKYNIDVFGHTWWAPGVEKFEHANWSQIAYNDYDENPIEKITERYKPKILSVDPPRNFFEDPKWQLWSKEIIESEKWPQWLRQNLHTSVSLSYSKEKIITLFQEYCKINKEKYDFVIVTRYDMVINDFPNLTMLEKNKLYVHNGHETDPKETYFRDYCFIMDPELLDGFKLYSYLPNYNIETLKRPTAEGFREQCFLQHFPEDRINFINIDTALVKGGWCRGLKY